MNSISVEKICEVTKGSLLEGGTLSAEEALKLKVSSVVTGSKECMPGALFVPIIGERVDAHNFIGDAYEHGARVCFTSRDTRAEGTDEMAYIRVADTKAALQQLGTWYRNCFEGKVIGVTGSVGKTTTKEMLATALSAGFKVLKTSGNKNSQIGVPMMMLELDNAKYNLATFEMGMSEPGEMEKLADIAQPGFALVTNIGVAHIANLGSQENIRTEKLKIVNRFPEEGGILFVNGEDPMLKDIRGLLPAEKNIKLVTFGLDDSSDYYAADIKTQDECTKFVFTDSLTGEKQPVLLPVIGTHNVIDAVAAMAVAKNFGISPAASEKKLEEYRPMNMRGGIETIKGRTLIDDTYNASPDSMRSGLNMLEEMKCSGRKIAVLADVLELGEFSKNLHSEVGEFAATKKIDKLITIGTEAKYIAEAAKHNGAGFEVISYPGRDEVYEKELAPLKEGDILYMKGSRGMRLDLLAEAFRQGLIT